MASQIIKEISVRRLRLWSENPRDPFVGEKTNVDIIKHAIKKWKIKSLAREMGNSFDFSELPTVVKHGNKNIVYDGNRRVALAMIHHKIYKNCNNYKFKTPSFPHKIPCNVCDQKTAFRNILRKHSDTGSWSQLNKDIFVYKHLGKDKTPLLLLEELTGLISKSKHLGKRYVGEEIFKKNILSEIGIKIRNNKIKSNHSIEDIRNILLIIEDLIENNEINTRTNRGDEKFLKTIKENTQHILNKNEDAGIDTLAPDDDNRIDKEKSLPEDEETTQNKKKNKKDKKKNHFLFGGNLSLKAGLVNDLYRDIDDTYSFYLGNKKILSENYPAIIRMGLRLLAETAAKNSGLPMSQFIESNFQNAKQRLSNDEKTFLSNQSVTKNKITQLLQTGAHNYQDSGNIDQAKAISIILGNILDLTEGK